MENKRKYEETTGITGNTLGKHSQNGPVKKKALVEPPVPSDDEPEEAPVVILRHKNRELSVLTLRLKRKIKKLKTEILRQEKKANYATGVLSCLKRSWDQLDLGLTNVLDKHNAKLDLEKIDKLNKDELNEDPIMKLVQPIVKFNTGDINYPLKHVKKMIEQDGKVAEEDEEDEEVLKQIDIANEKRILFTTGVLCSVWEKVGELEAKTNSNTTSTQNTADIKEKLQRELAIANSKLSFLVDTLVQTQSKLKVTTEEAEDAEIRANSATRKLQNLKEQLKHSQGARKMEIENSQENVKNEEETKKEVVENGSSSVETKEFMNRIADLEKLSENRMKEVEQSKQECLALAAKVSELEVKLGAVELPLESVRISRPYVELQNTLQQVKYEKQRELDEVESIKASEFEMQQKLHFAMERIRELETATDARWREYSVKQQEIVNELEIKLQSMTSQLHAQNADITQVESLKQRLVEVEQLLEASTTQRNILRKELDTAKSGHIFAGLEAQIASLKQDLSKTNAGEALVSETEARAKLTGAEAEISSLKQERESLYNEIESISSEVGNLESQHGRLLQQQADKDSQNATLMQNQMKIEGLMRKIAAENDLLRQKALQEENLRVSFEGKMKLMEDRLAASEAARVQSDAQLKLMEDKHKRSSLDVENAKNEMQGALGRETILREEIEKLKQINENGHKDRQEGIYKSKRLEENIASLKRKLNKAKSKIPRESNLNKSSGNKNIESLRLEAQESALRCPIYRQYWKDCILIKCCHMFSQKALKDNLAKRNRKCPTCKMHYSKDDIRQIYLYQENEYDD